LNMVDEAQLRRFPLFARIADPALRVLADRGVIRRYAPDQVLWRTGDVARELHLLIEGEVRVVRGSDGRQRVVHTEGPGGTLGEVPLFEGTCYPATAIASRRSTCIVFDIDTIVEAMRADPMFALTLLGRLAARVRHLIERLERMNTHSVPARLAAYLLERGARTTGAVITLGRSQQQVAEELGTAREVVVRALRTLREAGVLEAAGRGRLRVTDPAALRRLARNG
jgi:CRP/FNR family transcriptional regulator